MAEEELESLDPSRGYLEELEVCGEAGMEVQAEGGGLHRGLSPFQDLPGAPAQRERRQTGLWRTPFPASAKTAGGGAQQGLSCDLTCLRVPKLACYEAS